MSYNAEETSREDGAPIEVYDFNIGATTYRHTTSEETVTISGDDYTALAIIRDPLAVGGEERTQPIGVVIPSDHPFAMLYVNTVPGDRATVTIRRLHRYDGATQVIDLFKGRVQTVSFLENGQSAKIVVMPLTGSKSRTIPLFVYSSLCNHVLGQTTGLGGCPVDLDTDVSPIDGLAFKNVGLVTVVTANVLTINGVSDFPDGWFDGGFIKTATSDYRLILSHTGSTVRILVPFTIDMVGQTVSVYAGCAHDLVTCTNKFNVALDYGGYPFIPVLNPFQSGIGN